MAGADDDGRRGDKVAFAPGGRPGMESRDLAHLAPARIRIAAQVDDSVDSGASLGRDRVGAHSGQRPQRDQACWDIAGRVGVERGATALVACVKSSEDIADFGAAAFTEHNPVWPHPNGLAHQIGQGEFATALGVGGTCLKADEVPVPG
jgi:hypothetical protein